MAAKPVNSCPGVALTIGILISHVNPSGFGLGLVSTVVCAKLGSSVETSVVATNVLFFVL